MEQKRCCLAITNSTWSLMGDGCINLISICENSKMMISATLQLCTMYHLRLLFPPPLLTVLATEVVVSEWMSAGLCSGDAWAGSDPKLSKLSV